MKKKRRKLLRFSLLVLCIPFAACKMQACNKSPTEPESDTLDLLPLHKCPTYAVSPQIFDVEIEMEWDCVESKAKWAGSSQSQDCRVILGRGPYSVNCKMNTWCSDTTPDCRTNDGISTGIVHLEADCTDELVSLGFTDSRPTVGDTKMTCTGPGAPNAPFDWPCEYPAARGFEGKDWMHFTYKTAAQGEGDVKTEKFQTSLMCKKRDRTVRIKWSGETWSGEAP